MSNKKPKSYVQENLLKLYLRLNGYFVTGFIVHSPRFGRNRAEIDALAIRLPYNNEPERVIMPSAYLETTSDFIDLLICEVKSKGEKLHFNTSIYGSAESTEVVNSVLRWAGLLTEEEVHDLSPQVKAMLQPSNPANQSIPTLLGPRNTRIRAILCSPERIKKRYNQPWFIHGQEIFNYLWKCFCPEYQPPKCSTIYDFSLWGNSYEPLVRYFKDRKRQGQTEGTIKDLYRYLRI